MSDETLKRIELKNNPILTKITVKNSKNKVKNLDWKPHPQNLRRENKKKKIKKKVPRWER